MEERIYHGKITPKDFAQALMGEFNRGNYRAQSFGSEKSIVVQIVTRQWLETGGQTALSVTLKQVEDGVGIQIGKQAWLGVAASLGLTLFTAMRNPWNVLGRLDDLAQDIQSIQLTEDVNAVIERTAQSMNATFELSERLKRMICGYCNTANPVGAGSCIACGAPLGKVQPKTCSNCGFILKPTDKYCINCGKAVS
ncbi:MAG: zinc ribbon domain-containing protein [Anaerolineales bacterium]|jgi:RNase P subunit RPR2|nr:zinc ribbon domain-containing protein [Anaerolineales bacterium]